MKIYFVLFFMAFLLGIPSFIVKNNRLYQNNGNVHYLSYNKLNRQRRFLYIIAIFGSMFLLSCFRSTEVGTDTQTYINTFTHPELLSLKIDGNYKFERGYILLVKSIRLFTTNYRVFLVITSLIIYLGFSIFLYFNSSNIAASTLMFFPLIYWSTMSALRQNLAMVIVINSIYFIRKKKILPSIIIILIASQFHKTSLIFILALPIAYYGTSIYKVAFASLIMGIGTFASLDIFQFIVKYYPIYDRYLKSDMFKGAGNRGTIWLMFLFIVIFALYCLRRYKKNREKHMENDMYILISISILSIFIGLLGTQYGIFSRVARYFTPFLMLLTPAIIEQYFKHNSKLLVYILFTFCMFFYFFIVLRNDINGIVPYIWMA